MNSKTFLKKLRNKINEFNMYPMVLHGLGLGNVLEL